jgi:hypothetical protein
MTSIHKKNRPGQPEAVFCFRTPWPPLSGLFVALVEQGIDEVGEITRTDKGAR